MLHIISLIVEVLVDEGTRWSVRRRTTVRGRNSNGLKESEECRAQAWQYNIFVSPFPELKYDCKPLQVLSCFAVDWCDFKTSIADRCKVCGKALEDETKHPAFRLSGGQAKMQEVCSQMFLKWSRLRGPNSFDCVCQKVSGITVTESSLFRKA